MKNVVESSVKPQSNGNIFYLIRGIDDRGKVKNKLAQRRRSPHPPTPISTASRAATPTVSKPSLPLLAVIVMSESTPHRGTVALSMVAIERVIRNFVASLRFIIMIIGRKSQGMEAKRLEVHQETGSNRLGLGLIAR